jgi:hypothetical protein
MPTHEDTCFFGKYQFIFSIMAAIVESPSARAFDGPSFTTVLPLIWRKPYGNHGHIQAHGTY